jgi:hypothetical protein
MTTYTCHHSTTKWEWVDIVGQLLIWNPTPKISNQAISHFLDFWVERACKMQDFFIIPRILQRKWGYLAKHILGIGVFYPHALTAEYGVTSLIPFCVLFVPPYVCSLPVPDSLEPYAATPGMPNGIKHKLMKCAGLVVNTFLTENIQPSTIVNSGRQDSPGTWSCTMSEQEPVALNTMQAVSEQANPSALD